VLPGIERGGVEFAQVENLTLDDTVAADAETFADREVNVDLAIFGAGAAFEKQGAVKITRQVGVKTRGQVGPQAFSSKPALLLNY
jgi:hypothetical protein